MIGRNWTTVVVRCCMALMSLFVTPTGAVTLLPGQALGTIPRFGVNLGGRSVWGADQLMANVLRNPGLEATRDGALIVVGDVDGRRIEDDTPTTARVDGFWVGAQYEVLTGRAAGLKGRVQDDRRLAPGRPTSIWLEPPPAGVMPGDVVVLSGDQDTQVAPLWWRQGRMQAERGDRAPGSVGKQSLRLIASAGNPAMLTHHLDGITPRAGKLLPVLGRWHLSFWVKAERDQVDLEVKFERQGSRPWLHKTVTASKTWSKVEWTFQGDEHGPAAPIALTVVLKRGQVLVDEFSLSEDSPDPSGFRRAVVENLKRLRPGYLREWQGQLADSSTNRWASEQERQPVRYRPGEHEAQFMYGVEEFLMLCSEVGAQPWLILPAATTPDQARQYGGMLAQAQMRFQFKEIVVEYGNEHWNTIFRPAGIASPQQLGLASDRLMAAMKQGAGGRVPLHWVLGAQYVNPDATAQLLAASAAANGIAVAPYFLYRMDERVDAVERGIAAALHEDDKPLRQAIKLTGAARRSLDVYEVNFHTTLGDARASDRNIVMSQAAAGAALARRLMQAAILGVKRQAVYTLSGFDSFVSGAQRDLVHLWGITRDLSEAGRWRPTGLALLMSNRVVEGEAQTMTCVDGPCGDVTALGFDGGRRGMVVSSHQQAAPLKWPCPMGQISVQILSDSDGLAIQLGDPRSLPPIRKLKCEHGWLNTVIPPRALIVLSDA